MSKWYTDIPTLIYRVYIQIQTQWFIAPSSQILMGPPLLQSDGRMLVPMCTLTILILKVTALSVMCTHI